MCPAVSREHTFQDSDSPSRLGFSCGYHGAQGFDEANDSQSWLWQVRRENVLVQRCLAIFNFDYGLIQEGESKGVARGKDDDIDRLFLGGVVEYDRVFLHFLYAWLDEHFPSDDPARKLVI